MDPIQIKMLAVSTAGHDKGKTYAVLCEEEGCVFLADGRNRKIGKPKRKNRIHIQPVIHIQPYFEPDELSAVSDADLRRILRIWQTRKKEDEDR